MTIVWVRGYFEEGGRYRLYGDGMITSSEGITKLIMLTVLVRVLTSPNQQARIYYFVSGQQGQIFNNSELTH